MSEERIYSSGREPYFNLNSTWYDPAGSWLDNRRKPFCYVENTACVTCCNPRTNVPRRGGHNYRCYCYRRSTCRPGGNPRVRCCVHNPSGGPRDYWGRPIGDACNGCTGGYYSHGDCGSCCGSSGECGTGGGLVACAQPCVSSGGVCAEPGCRPAGRGWGSGRGVCAEPECSASGCGSRRRGVCSEPCARASGGC
ncbi:keratin-associated protein 5-4-like [Python bivittatus]|uniref:Keratin-associated protein 5-4-like n=1 Tax=Python bivittatus TaxID=176946 RepID=A0A9F5J583_PYTBI|nr:keratin-associated protein 5-4-like [Python bivittatus]